jgi:hypothetical protein
MLILSNAQKWIIAIASVLILLSVCVPPWVHTYRDHRGVYSEYPAGYAFIAFPPEREEERRGYGIKIDIDRIAIQVVAILIVCALGVILTFGGGAVSEQSDDPVSDEDEEHEGRRHDSLGDYRDGS